MEVIDSHRSETKRRRRRTPCGSHRDDNLSPESATGVEENPFASPSLRAVKRTFDLTLAALLLVLLLPVMTLIAVAIKCVSGGPVFYCQWRQGRQGQPFRIWKFRTMVEEAEGRLDEHFSENPELHQEWTNEFKLKNDPRVLPGVGRVLRDTGLDELPQIWNVIRGEMSLVGPRPLPQYHLDQFDHDFCRLRESMPPGITGQWQICARNDRAGDSFRKWDTHFIRNWSLWLDLHILIKTIPIVFTRFGAG